MASHISSPYSGRTKRQDGAAIHILEKREVDFVVVRNNEPWFLVEVKQSLDSPSPHLTRFQKALAAPHAFQAVLDLPFVDADCFGVAEPVVVPARTLLSQLP